jgi:anthranilate 1,2-dioxygenase small subunit
MSSAPDYAAILSLEYRYAQILDDDRLEEWPDLFVDDGVYKVIPRENRGRPHELAIMFCDSRAMMVDRVHSLRQANIYNLHYPRHIVTNVEMLAQHGDQCDVAAAYTVYQTDLEGQTRLFSVGQYLDTVVLEGGRARFRRKIVICDTFSIPNLLAIPL